MPVKTLNPNTGKYELDARKDYSLQPRETVHGRARPSDTPEVSAMRIKLMILETRVSLIRKANTLKEVKTIIG